MGLCSTIIKEHALVMLTNQIVLTLTCPLEPIERISKFDYYVENVSTYLEQLQQYFMAYQVEGGFQAAALLSCIGGKTYGILKTNKLRLSLLQFFFTVFVVAMESHFDHMPLVLAQKFHFRRRMHGQDEFTDDFPPEDCRRTILSNFGNHKDEAFFSGLKGEAVC